MAQISIYIDDHTLKLIEIAAEKEHVPISKLAKKCLVSSLNTVWPKDYFDLWGTLTDASFKRPIQGKFSKDRERSINETSSTKKNYSSK